jgi:hypothetical protein
MIIFVDIIGNPFQARGLNTRATDTAPLKPQATHINPIPTASKSFLCCVKNNVKKRVFAPSPVPQFQKREIERRLFSFFQFKAWLDVNARARCPSLGWGIQPSLRPVHWATGR